MSDSQPQRRSLQFTEPPEGCSFAALEKMLRERMPERGDALSALARRSVRLWPGRASSDEFASRFGGRPVLPKSFDWPVVDQEPLLFLAQINCAEIGRQVEAPELPFAGILSFFGDHDEVNGCGPGAGGAVFYFPNVDEFTLASPPADDFEPLISCGIVAYESYELPHPYEHVVVALRFSEKEWSDYIDLRLEVAAAAPRGAKLSKMQEFQKLMSCWYDTSKLFGWPDLIQYDWPGHISRAAWRNSQEELIAPTDPDRFQRLLLQIGEYRDGVDSHGWGPGGLVYFMIENEDFAARRFERAELAVQCS